MKKWAVRHFLVVLRIQNSIRNRSAEALNSEELMDISIAVGRGGFFKNCQLILLLRTFAKCNYILISHYLKYFKDFLKQKNKSCQL